MSEGKKKLSGYQNLINKRKREEVLESTNKKITQFFKAPIDSSSEAPVKNDYDNMEPSTSSSVEVENTVTFIEADDDEVFDSKTVHLSKDPGENKLKLTALARGFCSNCCPAKIQRDIRFVAYSKNNPNGIPINNLYPGDAYKAGVDNSIPTVIFIHGFSEASPGHSGQTILDAYLARPEPRNIILVDWSELATFPWYQVAVINARLTAQTLKKFIEVFHRSGEIPIWNLHVIGFSLGGHIAGFAGKLLRDGLRIPRITGLDPALPEYSLQDPSQRLSKESANYVDVIHTDAGVFGFPLSIGHADFFPNGGRALQPGCQPSYLVKQRIVDQVVACSHIRVWKLYAESVINEKAFPATRCPLWRGPNKQCEFMTEAYMGFANEISTFGSFYLITHESKPFGRRY